MMIKHYALLFDQYIVQLNNELEAFPENELWNIRGQIANSAGTLGLHLCGNLQFFIGATLGGDGYIRHREEEFSSRVSKAELLQLVNHTRNKVAAVFSNMPESELSQVRKFELRSLSEPVATGYFLSHLAAHLGYHVGQLNYMRRLLF